MILGPKMSERFLIKLLLYTFLIDMLIQKNISTLLQKGKILDVLKALNQRKQFVINCVPQGKILGPLSISSKIIR